jgi:hypothetical protein
MTVRIYASANGEEKGICGRLENEREKELFLVFLNVTARERLMVKEMVVRHSSPSPLLNR